MQILMGVNHTVVHLRSVNLHYNEIVNYVKEQFSTHFIENNTIQLHYSDENHHKHLFLLKWLCALHQKNNRFHSEDLREVLLNRMHKPVHIVCKSQINPVHLIDFRLISLYTMRIDFKNINYQLFSLLHRYMGKMVTNVSYLHGYFDIKIDSVEYYRRIESLLVSEVIDGFKIKCLFQQKELNLLVTRLMKSDTSDTDIISSPAKSDTPEQVKKRYKKLLAKYHPDTVFHEGVEKVQEYTEIFQQLQASYSHYLHLAD